MLLLGMNTENMRRTNNESFYTGNTREYLAAGDSIKLAVKIIKTDYRKWLDSPGKNGQQRSDTSFGNFTYYDERFWTDRISLRSVK